MRASRWLRARLHAGTCLASALVLSVARPADADSPRTPLDVSAVARAASVDGGIDADRDAMAVDAEPDARVDGSGDALLSDAGSDAPSMDAGGIFQPGTQPHELSADIRPPSLCENCHGSFASYAANDTWKGTMMANATRDPLFHAALAVANQDVPGSGDLCIRCHSPRAWLFGRSEPPDLGRLEPDDFEGVSCDFCHRLTRDQDGSTRVGNAQYRVADDYIRRGPLSDAKAPHDWQYSSYHEESRLCALCHDVSNPTNGGFAIERTYTEWASSAFADEGQSCQGCHMPSVDGPVCGAPGSPSRTAHRHQFAGGNYWMPAVLKGEHPELGRAAAYEETVRNATTMLQHAATVGLSAPAQLLPGGTVHVTARVENLTGHKLPTGYPEGRRMWLSLDVRDSTGRVVFASGDFDPQSGTRSADPQLRTYEVRMSAGGREGFHFMLQDAVIEDSRIPPRGFRPQPDTRPVGRSYAGDSPDGGATLVHWDVAPYDIPLDSSVIPPLLVHASLLYQSTSREYVQSLRDANRTDDAGAKMLALFEQYGGSPPLTMAETSITIEGEPLDASQIRTDGSSPRQPDADALAVPDGDDAGAASSSDGSGCSCRVGPRRAQRARERRAASTWWLAIASLLATVARFLSFPRGGTRR